ncbi:MAG TPA: LysR family transcriptional regulator [Kofleriaceae bacterium]|nr:LysR family transcriptional regulator [Kofleriaceae bacterium]
MLNFNHVYYFHVAATEGSVKAAAERLGVSQPTVSEQIKMLERALGVSLFDRTGMGLRLTEPGRDAYEHTTAMFRAGERLVHALGHASDPPPVQLRIGVSAAISRTIAADFLMPVLTVPECRPVIRTGDALDLIRELRAHDLDLVVGDTEPVEAAQRGLDVVTLHRPRLIAIAAASVTPRPDWQNLSLLEHRNASAYRWEVDAYLEEKGLKPQGVAELDDAFLMLEAVSRGGFVAFVPRSVARDAIKNGRVKVIAELDAGSAAVYALYHRRDHVDLARKAVELLAEHAKTHFAL